MRQMSVADSRRVLVFLLVTAVSVALLVLPVDATHLSQVDSDVIVYRTASCGMPVASLLGADPELDAAGSQSTIGADTAETACEAASGKRVAGALLILVAASLVWGLRGRRTSPVAATRRADRLSVSP